MEKDNTHFYHVFWFIVGLCAFGAALTVFLITYLPEKSAERVADTALIFWLSTAVSGGIGYLLGSNATQNKKNTNETILQTPENSGTTTTTIVSEPKNPTP